MVLQGLWLLECSGGHSRWLLVTLSVGLRRRALGGCGQEAPGPPSGDTEQTSSEGYPCMAVLGSHWALEAARAES